MASSAALAAVALPAAAAPQNDSDLSTRETRAVVHAYAKCVVAKAPRKAAEAIQRNVDNRTMLKEYPVLMNPDCLETGPRVAMEARFTGDLYRYALADALVVRDLAAFTGNDFSAVPKLEYRLQADAPAAVDSKGRPLNKKKYEAAVAAYERNRVVAYVALYGECVARTAPAETQALLLTKPDSPEESLRFKALAPALGGCLASGETLRFGKVTLRGTLAMNYYRLATAARVAGTRTVGS